MEFRLFIAKDEYVIYETVLKTFIDKSILIEYNLKHCKTKTNCLFLRNVTCCHSVFKDRPLQTYKGNASACG